MAQRVLITPETKALIVSSYPGKSLNQLRKETGHSLMGIRRVLLSNNAAMNKPGCNSHPFVPPESVVAEVIRLRKNSPKTTLDQLASMVGVSVRTVSRIVQASGLSRPICGPHSASWKHGRYVTAEGYIRVRVQPGDLLMDQMGGLTRSVLEHRLVIARALGRPLESWETVHHIDGDKKNSRASNLQLRIGKHGKGMCLRCAACGSTDIVAEAVESQGGVPSQTN